MARDPILNSPASAGLFFHRAGIFTSYPVRAVRYIRCMTKTMAAVLALGLAMIAQAHGATTSTVVDIPAASGGTQRFLWVRPDAPIATLVNIPGGTGIYNFTSDGGSSTSVGACSPPYRLREALAARGIAVVLLDATSSGSVGDPRDVTAVVREIRRRDSVPTWVSGGSASTGSAGLAALSLPADIPGGVLFVSPDRPPANVSQITRPAGVIYHSGDSLAFGNLMYNALTSAVARERISISAGTDQGCGFHLFNGAEAELVEATVGVISRLNAAAQGATALNFQGLWWAGEAESGWGVNLAHQGDILFMTWFTYDTDGSAMWLVASDMRKTTGNTFTGTLRRTTGPVFSTTPYPASQVQQAVVGAATFTFTSADAGRFDYTVNGVTQSKNVTRLVFDPARAPVCTSGGSGTPNLQDLWIPPDPAEQAWGVNVVQQGDVLFATWFTYDSSSRGQWYVMSNLARQSDGRFTGGIQRTTGPAFSAQPFNPNLVSRIDVGTATFDFNVSPATFTYTVGSVTQTRQIQRYVFANPPTVCR